MAVVATVFVGILVGCYFIKYPDLVQAPVVITTINPPTDLYARYDRLISRASAATTATTSNPI